MNWLLRLVLECALLFVFLEGVRAVFGVEVEDVVAWVMIASSAVIVFVVAVVRARA